MAEKKSQGKNTIFNLLIIVSITTCLKSNKNTVEYEIDIEEHDRTCGAHLISWVDGSETEYMLGYTVEMKRACNEHKHKSFYLIYPEGKKFKIFRDNKKFYHEELDLNCTTCSDCEMRLIYGELGLRIKCVDDKVVRMCFVSLVRYDVDKNDQDVHLRVGNGPNSCIIVGANLSNYTHKTNNMEVGLPEHIEVPIIAIPKHVVRKTLSLTAKSSDATKQERQIMQDKSTSLEKKRKICEKNVKFENFTDYNDLEWSFESRRFIDGHADDDFLFCKTELVATTVVEDEKSFINALKPMKSLTTFGDSLQLIDIVQKIDEKSLKYRKNTNPKVIIISGIVLFLLFLMGLAARTACRKPQKKQLKIEIPKKSVSTAGTNNTGQSAL
ncbi:hypothetical protein SNEBB_007557 [Seison nebaliae]|nr:hypothetical protein SNEBB_007557 [Seison nebaliae]